MKSNWIALLFILFCLLWSCHSKKQAENSNQIPTIAIDSADFEGVFKSYTTGIDEKICDTLYRYLIEDLFAKEKYSLISGHTQKYLKAFPKGNNQQAYGNRVLGEMCEQFGQKDSAKYYFDQSLKFAKLDNDSIQTMWAINSLGMNQSYRFNFTTSNRYYLEALEYAKSLKDSNMISSIKVNLASNSLFLNQFNKAISYVNEAKNYFEQQKDSLVLGDMHAWLCIAYTRKGSLDSAFQNGQKAIQILEKQPSEYALANAYANMGSSLLKMGLYQEAIENFDKTFKIFEKFEFSKELNTSYLNKFSCKYHLGFYDEAEIGFKNYLSNKNTNFIKEQRLQCYRELVKLNLKRNKLDETYDFFEKYINLHDSIYSVNNARTIEDYNTYYETKEKEKIIADLDANIQKEQSKNKIFIVGIIFILFLSVSSATIYYKYTKKQKQLLNIQRSLDAKNLAETKEELEINKQQLIDFRERLLAKNIEIEKYVSEQSQLSGNKDLSVGEDENLQKLRKLKILTESDWQEFRSKFIHAYPDLISRLELEFDNLTSSELRLFLLMKLQIDSKEIADMLGISLESVRKGRYRLKKKINLSENDSLEDWINRF